MITAYGQAHRSELATFMHAEGVRENTGFFNTGWVFVIFLPEHLEKTAFLRYNIYNYNRIFFVRK
jgi:hypothetical protein